MGEDRIKRVKFLPMMVGEDRRCMVITPDTLEG
jgi:hypothetical protein